MSFLIVLLLVAGIIAWIAIRAAAAKRRILRKAIELSAQVPATRVYRQGNVTVRTTTSSSGEMPQYARDILQSMGGVEKILDSPAVRDALREAVKHPGQTTTVTTTSESSNPAVYDPFTAPIPATSPFDLASNPFAADESGAAPPPPVATRSRTAAAPGPPAAIPFPAATGERGKAIVRTATMDISGVWHFELEVTPERGWPYRAELFTIISTPERQARLCQPGAEIPILYDPANPKALTLDEANLRFKAT